MENPRKIENPIRILIKAIKLHKTQRNKTFPAYSKLEKLQRATEPSQQRSNYDEIQKILANLSALGVRTDEEYLKEKIIKKFSMNTLRWVWSLLDLGRLTPVSQLMEALHKVVSRDDDIAHFFRDEPAPSTSNTGKKADKRNIPALIGSPTASECIFCTLKHASQDCRKFGTLQKRKSQVIASKRCLICTQLSHRATKCPSAKVPCEGCSKQGHCLATCVQYILRKKNKASENDKAKGTFLETFTCEVKGVVNYFQVRGILDGGSMCSYISNDLVKKLNLRTGKRSLSEMCRFGSDETYIQSSSEVIIRYIKR